MTALATPAWSRLLLGLVGAYIVALFALPADLGLEIAGSILTPARTILALALLTLLVRWRFAIPMARTIPRSIWLGWLLFLGSCLVSLVLYPSNEALGRYGSLVLEGLCVFAVVYCAAQLTSGARALAAVFVGAIAAVAVVALVLALSGARYVDVMVALGSAPFSVEPQPRLGLARDAASFRSPLFFAIWLTIAGALLPGLAATARRNGRALAAAAWVTLLLAVALLTTSRIAITAYFALPGVYFLVRGRRALGVLFLVLSVVSAVGLTILSLNPDFAGADPGETGALLAESNGLRLAAINATIEAVSLRPLFGWGLLNDRAVLGALIGEPNWVDNTYLSFLVEIGIAGTLAFFALAAGFVRASWRATAGPLGFSLVLATVAVLAFGVFASIFQVTQSYAAFFVLAGLAVAAARSPAAPSDLGDHLVLGAESPAPSPPRVGQVPPERSKG